MIYLDWHLGLGDAIICNGLVRHLAKSEALVVPCYEHNLPTVRHMFSDMENVMVLPVTGDAPPDRKTYPNVVSCGMRHPRWGSVEPWDRAFYEFAGVPFDAKWDLFHVPESGSELFTHALPLGVLHDDVARDISIDLVRLPKLDFYRLRPVTSLLTDWRWRIMAAPEIHVIDSAPMHLVELLPTTGKLFYHKYARAKGNRQHSDATLRKDWTVIE